MNGKQRTELDRLLPKGDPSSPFDPKLLQSLRSSGSTAQVKTRRSTKQRRNRDRALMVAIASTLCLLVGVIGVLLVNLRQSSSTERDKGLSAQLRNGELGASGVGSAGTVNSDASTRPAPRSSGLPSVPGLSDLMQAADEETVSLIPVETEPESGMIQELAEPAAMQLGQNVPSEEDIELSESELQQWQERLRTIRTLLGNHQFSEASERLDEAASLARTRTQRQQLARVRTIAGLAQQFNVALVESIDGLEAAETFTAADQAVSFVQGDRDQLIVRMRGRNLTYRLTEIPIALAFGLVDLRLPLESPRSKSLKAAYAVVHPASSQVNRTNAKKLLQELAALGTVPPDTHQIVDDWETTN